MLLPKAFEDKIQKRYIPIDASFELTWKCNLRCVHCYQNPPCSNELTNREVKDILDQLAKSGCLFLSFTGGEPLVRKDFLDIAGYAKRRNFAIYLKTNGTLITSSMAKRFRRLNFLEVHISVYGATPQTHDGITRKEGSYQKIIEGVRLLKGEEIKVRLMVTLMKQNINELERMKVLADTLKVDIYYSPVIFARHDKGKEPLEFRLADRDLRSFYSDNSVEEEYLDSDSGRPSLLCQFGRTSCTITSIGQLYPCVGTPIVAGNLREQTFAEIWQTSPLLRRIRSLIDSDLKGCSTCSLFRYCFRCSGAAYLEGGNLCVPHNDACRLARIKKEAIDGSQKK